jgi:exopolysaccharide biosynthesis protein
VLVVGEQWGVTLETLSYLMVELGASEAINIDGGGSSQLWFAGQDLVYSARPVAEGMLVFSTLNPSIGEERPLGN